jgi:hypothetical protein
MLLSGGYFYDPSEGLIPHYISQPKFVILSDARFANEVVEAKSNGAIAIKIVRSETSQALVKHASEELNIPDTFFDYHINNSGILENLYKQLRNIMKKRFGVL